MNTKTVPIRARLAALLLGLCLLLGQMPLTASAQEPDFYIFGYSSGSRQIASVSTADQSNHTRIADFTSSLLGLEYIDGTIYGLYCNNSFTLSSLVILNPDFTVQRTVGSWINSDFVIVDTAVQDGTLWGTYNDAQGDSYLIPIDLATGMPDSARAGKVTGLPEGQILYTIACSGSGPMYAVSADGGEDGGAATLYTVDTSSFAAAEVGGTGVTTNYISSSAFAPDGTLYWSENLSERLYTVNTATGKATAVPGGSSGLSLEAMMIPDNGGTAAYVNFTAEGEEGAISMNGQPVTGLQAVTAGEDLALTFTPGSNSNVQEVVIDGEKQGSLDSFTLRDVSAWGKGIHTVEVTFGSKNIRITPYNDTMPYFGENTLNVAPSFEATLYFIVENGPARHTAGVSNYEISFEKDGNVIDKKDLLPGSYDVHVTRAADKNWNALDTVLKDGLTITRQTFLYQWSDLELTARPGDTLADIEKPAFLVSPIDGKEIPGTFYWIDEETASAGDLGDRTGFRFRFVPDLPLSAELSALYDFSNMPENGFDGTETDPNYPFTAYVTVVEAEVPGVSAPVTLPVRVLEEGDADYSPAPDLSAVFTPDEEITAGDFGPYDGLAIDYYYPMLDPELSEGYTMQAEYNLSLPLENYAGDTLTGTLTLPLPQGCDGASARIKGGPAASSHTATSVSFPVTLDVESGTASVYGLLIEYKEAPPVIIAGANGSWLQGSDHGLSFTSNAQFSDFLKVQVDGNDLDSSCYTMKEGSTIVTLLPAYLKTLSAGQHTLAIVSANGAATTHFTITPVQTSTSEGPSGQSQPDGGTPAPVPDQNSGTPAIPQTGDSSSILLWAALLLVSGASLTAAVLGKKRRRAK